MKVIRRDKMPNGTDIQQEDWSMNYSFYAPKSTIAVYPLAIMTNESGLIGRGDKFRLELDFNSEKEANKCYENLISGKSKINDYKENGIKNEFDLLGENL